MNDKVHYRMCAGCRKIMHKDKLLRVCRIEKKIFVDKTNKMGGRGAYICSEVCLKNAEKGRKIERILKTSVSPEIWAALYKELENESR